MTADVAPLTPGRILYLLYHYPLAELRRSVRLGGPRKQWLDRRGRKEMERAAMGLRVPNFGSGPALGLHQLTGHAYISQSIFCLGSLAQAAKRNIVPIFYDDGSLTASDLGKLGTAFPGARVIRHDETLARVETLLPASRFPALRERFQNYALIRKLINIHLGGLGWKLVLDADLLFFRRPDFLLDWLADPQRPLHMLDIADAYGYSRGLMEKLAGRGIPARVNVGLCGMRSDAIAWEKLEWWCASLLRLEGSHYLLEQALTALLLAGQDCDVAPAGDYITMPDCAESLSPRGVMHHYVHDSKRWYFRSAWRNVSVQRE